MSDNKFIQRLKGKQTPKSVVEVQNDKLVAPFTGVPYSTDVVGAIVDDKDSSVVVAKGAQNWKLDGSSLVTASSLTGDGADYTSEFNASGSGLWINATYSLPDMIFNAGTKWVLKLCGKNLLNASGETIGFTLVVKVGATHITSKTFTVAEGANVFCRQLVIDFSESEQAVIKAQSGDSLTLQLLCADANASATIYNGMTVLTALQRKVDSENVSSNTATFDDLETKIGDIEEQMSDLGDDFVKIDGSSIMTAPLKFMAGSMRGAVGPYLNGVGFWKLDSQANLTLIATISDSQFIPNTTNATDFGNYTKKWKDLYLNGKAYVGTINNGRDISVPSYDGTMVVADFSRVAEGMFLRLDRDLHPIWETVTLTTSLSSLTDVTITSATGGQVLAYDGSKWVNRGVSIPTVNYSINGGNYTAGTGTYAITRFSLMLQKADGTWEKPTDTSANYSQATNKTVNTNGFLLNQILYYNNTTGISGGQLTGLNKVYSKHATVPMSYSTNCGATPGWALGTWIYLVGTLGADGLFYLDTTQWWSDALPNSADGKLYIRLGPASSSTGDTVALLEDRPIFYHDGNGIKEYIVRPSDIPTVNNPTITIRQGGVDKGSFTLNQSTGDTIDLDAGGVSVGTSIDAEIVGTLTITDNSVVSGFSANNYLKLPGVFELGSSDTSSFEIGAAFIGGNISHGEANVLLSGQQINSTLFAGLSISFGSSSDRKLRVQIRGSGATQTIVGTTDLGTEKVYIKLQYDGANYNLLLSNDGSTYTQETNVAATQLATPAVFCIGHGGSSAVNAVDLSGCYIKKNGVIIWQGMDAPGLHQRVAKGHEVIEFQAPTGTNKQWYRQYANGWVEQGGVADAQTISAGYSSTQTITFLKAMADTDYTITFGAVDGSQVFQSATFSRTTTGGTLTQMNRASSGSASIQFSYIVCGMAA